MTQKLPPPLPVQVRITETSGLPTTDFHRFMSGLYDWLKDHLTWKATFNAGQINATTTFAALPITSIMEPGPIGAFPIVGGNHIVVRDAGTYSMSVDLVSTGAANTLVGGLSKVATAADIVQVSVPAGQTVTASKTGVVLAAGASVYVTVKAAATSPVKAESLTLIRTGA
jgi:hypothetical protein